MGFAQKTIAAPCELRGNYLEVNLFQNTLYLCSQKQSMKAYPISHGRGGSDKHMHGDSKTPIGRYRLGTPRPSERFFVFIPIGYPTPEQKARGYTGTDVGVHGPLTTFDWAGVANTWVNWTDGCIAVASEYEIAEIAHWVNQGHVSWIVIN